MKLCHIVAHIDEEASGPSYSVPRLCQAVADTGHDVTLVTLDRGGGARDLGPVCHRSFPQVSFPRKLGRSPAMRAWLHGLACDDIDVIHSHGLWMLPNLYPSSVASRAGIPHVIAPRGTLDPAARSYSRWLKQLIWFLGQGAAVRGAAALHATSDLEASHLRALNLRNPIILSPNGVDIPAGPRPPRGSQRTVLYLGRLHEKKGLNILLRAWAKLEAKHLHWSLRIVGKGSAEFEAGIDRDIGTFGLTRVTRNEALYGSEKLAALQASDLLVLPTQGENFGMVVAEALAAGTPVVTTRGAPWSGLITHRCGWWTEIDPDALRVALDEGMSNPPEVLEALGARGRAWMQRSYGWGAIGAQMVQAYDWLRKGGSRPNCVLQD